MGVAFYISISRAGEMFQVKFRPVSYRDDCNYISQDGKHIVSERCSLTRIYIISRRHHRDAPVEIMLLGMGHSLELLLSGFDLRVAGSHGVFFFLKRWQVTATISVKMVVVRM